MDAICLVFPATEGTPHMVRTLLIRGMLVGLVAGLLVFGFGKLVGEPQVDRAITFETAMDEAKAKADMAKGMPMPADKPELVSREVQASFGLFTGVSTRRRSAVCSPWCSRSPMGAWAISARALFRPYWRRAAS